MIYILLKCMPVDYKSEAYSPRALSLRAGDDSHGINTNARRVRLYFIQELRLDDDPVLARRLVHRIHSLKG